MLVLLLAAASMNVDANAAERFANLALACVHREYPNHIQHLLHSDADARPPRQLTPAFYGCYDWHSSVHGHWLLARLARLFPDAPFTPKAMAALSKSLTRENISVEVEYIRTKGRSTFERPYGLAWLLQLGAELREWDSGEAQGWAAAIEPLETAAVERLKEWLPKLSYPVRTGVHSQTAFAFGLMHDWAAGHDPDFRKLLEDRIGAFYMRDVQCPLSYEPSGEDFLSPCLAEADLMRRVLPPEEYAAWLGRFLPHRDLKPAVVTDPTDPRIAHLDGLNLSRAWMLEGIASGLPQRHPRRAALLRQARAHADAGLKSVTGEHYEGGHWLGSFAVYLTTQRGITGSKGLKP
jgi:hypothetical protein